MIPKRNKPHEENVDAWLMSYADMITLLLCFFVIFVSVSEPKKDKMNEIAEGMVDKFGALAQTTPLKDALQSLQAIVEKDKLFKDVAITNKDNGVEMELASERFFNTNSAEFNEDYKSRFDEMVKVLSTVDTTRFAIIVESHTDDNPPQNGLYPTNWEFSATRAAKVARMLADAGINTKQLRATGYADSRPKVPNRDDKGQPIENNQQKNQRIVIKLEEIKL